MIEIKKKLINKKFVHKAKEENVLIYNLRRTLPLRIKKDIFENVILVNLNKEEKELIKKSYILSKNKKDPYYIMYNIPHMIDVSYVRQVISEKILTKDEFRILSNFYIKNKTKENYVLRKNITEIDEIQILKLFKKKDVQIFDYDNREKIANILEKIDDFEKNDIFFANMFADKHHTFFFEHSIEHVPAMMMIEASRQFLIAICHIFGKIPVEGISFILSGMQVEFKNYLELNYPIKMIAEINKVKKKKDGRWKSEININISFYQNNNKCSSINYIGRIISSDIFKQLRKSKTIYKEPPRFNPTGMFYNNLSLRDCDNNKYLCKIADLSESGFQLEFNEPIFNLDNKKFEFFVFFQEIGFIHGKCELKWHLKNREDITEIKQFPFRGGFKIVEINDSDLINLKESIKRFCYVKTEREYL